MKIAKYLLGLSAVAASFAAQAGPYTEGFNDVGTLTAGGWTTINQSMPAGQGWFQGDNTNAFAAQSGPANSYLGANYLSAANGSSPVDLWLISPYLTLGAMPSLSFYARSGADLGFDDTLAVLFSADISAATSSFTTLLASFTLPTDTWTLYSLNLPTVANGRIALRYTANLANYIGIDTVTLDVAAIPEPSTYALMAMGLVGLAMARLRKSA